MDDVPLPAGRMSHGIVRQGDTVRRPMGEWSPTVHTVLTHLESVGFVGAPRFVGVSEGSELLQYISGDVPQDPSWVPGSGLCFPDYAQSDDVLTDLGTMLRASHSATENLKIADAQFRFSERKSKLPGEVISHGDLGPWHTVYRSGCPVAFIDWDSVQPMDRLVDLALAAWSFVPLGPVCVLEPAGLHSVEDQERRLDRLLESYGTVDTELFAEALRQAKLESVKRVRYWPVGSAETSTLLTHAANELNWLDGFLR
jgi:hypothetical protein